MQEGFCVCEVLENFDDSHKLKRGASVAAYFPDNALFAMDPEFPKDIKLADCIRNDGGFILASKPLMELMRSANGNHVEYLRVKILNHKKRVASTEYFIINPLDILDAIDFDHSSVEWNLINPELISSCSKLALNKEKIAPELKMWRLKFFPRRVLLRRDLAEAIRAAGFTGVTFTEIEDFSGF